MTTELLIKDHNTLAWRSLFLDDGFSTFGREPGSAIVMEHVSVSRHHGAFFLRERFGILTVEDHGSTNGTLVNGMQIKRKILFAGDVVQVGNFQLYVRHGSTLGSASAGEGDAHQG